MGTELYDLTKSATPKGLVSSSYSLPTGYSGYDGVLSNATRMDGYYNLPIYQIEKIYETISIIRAIHDGIANTIASLDWKVASRYPDKPAKDFHINQVKEFCQKPNKNKEPLQKIIRKWVHDVLKFDVYVGELIFNTFKEFQNEIYARYAPEFYPIMDGHGILKGYEQRFENIGTQTVYFDTNEILYGSNYDTTKNTLGIPKIASILPEICIFAYANQFIKDYFDKSKIPLGILAFEDDTSIPPSTELSRYGALLQEMAETQKNHIEVPKMRGKGIHWVELKGTDKNPIMIDILLNVCKQIFTAYGISPVDMGQAENSNRATAIVQTSISESKLIRPIAQMIQNDWNTQVINPYFYDDVIVVFGTTAELDPKTKLEITTRLVDADIMKINEARLEWGRPALSDEEIAKIEERKNPVKLNQHTQTQGDNLKQPRDEKKAKEENQNREGKKPSRKNFESNIVYEILKKEFLIVQKNLLIELSRSYFDNGNTSNPIELASNSIYGKLKNSFKQNKIQCDLDSISNFANDLKLTIKDAIKKYRRSGKHDRNEFYNTMKYAMKDNYNSLKELALDIEENNDAI